MNIQREICGDIPVNTNNRPYVIINATGCEREIYGPPYIDKEKSKSKEQTEIDKTSRFCISNICFGYCVSLRL